MRPRTDLTLFRNELAPPNPANRVQVDFIPRNRGGLSPRVLANVKDETESKTYEEKTNEVDWLEETLEEIRYNDGPAAGGVTGD